MLLTQMAFARDLTVQQKLSDLNELVGHIESGYGPLHYKQQKMGLDVEKLKSKYMALAMNTKTNAEFYYLMIRFVAEFNDSHFRASLPTTLETYLGFTTDLVQGKVVIDEVDRTVLPQEKFPFNKGDEIVSMGGKKMAEVLKELVPYMGQGYELSAKRKAAMMVAKRKANKVPPQFGKVELEIASGNTYIPVYVTLEWKQKGDFTDETKSLKLAKPRVNYDMISLGEEKFRCSGETRIKIPADATMIMKTPFVAYYYPTEKGNVGYLRIPHYSPEEANPLVDAKKLRFAQYEYAVRELEKKTVGLIIDQDHNCGGSVDWLHKFLSLFMNQPFAPMSFELLANKSSFVDFSTWLKEETENTVSYANAVGVLELIKHTWLNTNDFLTKKTPISGEDFIYPNPIRYTKPIVVLIDEMSGSGGDAFPALMQGLGRAKLLGTRTMGAGGHVVSLPPLNYSQVKVDMTKSLFYRPDDVAVENNGAEPDIQYSPTLEDFVNGYHEYQRFYTAELLKLI